MNPQRRNKPDIPPSIGRIALISVTAGIVVLLISVPIILGVAQLSPLAALIVALLALVLSVAVMGIVANRMVNGIVDRELSRRAEESSTTETTTEGE